MLNNSPNRQGTFIKAKPYIWSNTDIAAKQMT